MNCPSQLQAHVFWLHAAGMNARQIGDSLGCTPQAAQATLDAAKRKAAQIGMTYKIALKEKPATPDKESGIGMALRLAREANLIK
jgi:hypothetical protein